MSHGFFARNRLGKTTENNCDKKSQYTVHEKDICKIYIVLKMRHSFRSFLYLIKNFKSNIFACLGFSKFL